MFRKSTIIAKVYFFIKGNSTITTFFYKYIIIWMINKTITTANIICFILDCCRRSRREGEEELGETDSCHITYTSLPKAATRGYTESWVLFVKLKDFVKLIVLSLILVVLLLLLLLR